MGTRADFYVGRGKQAEWVGSIAWDGYPDGLKDHPFLLTATTEAVYRQAVEVFLANRNDATKPEDGWPWPWNNSGTTDYAYAYDNGKVWGYGSCWFDASETEPDTEDDDYEAAEFPDMSGRKSVTFGKRSGLIVVTEKGILTED